MRGPGPRRSASCPGTSTNRSRRSRFRTLQTRLNLKKSVTQPRNERKSQTSGSRPRSETSVPFTAHLVSPIRTGWVRRRAGTARCRAARCSASFLLRPQAGAYALAADQRGDLEALRVIGALLVEQQVRGRLAELALGDLLEVALVVEPALALHGRVDLRLDVRHDEPPGRLHPAVEVDRADEALEHVGQDRGRASAPECPSPCP